MVLALLSAVAVDRSWFVLSRTETPTGGKDELLELMLVLLFVVDV